MLVLNGYESHQSINFEAYYKTYNIILMCLPFHSSHITQLLDVGFFSPLKKVYNKEINTFIRAHINNIIKVEFFLVFRAAYKCSMTISNIIGGFRGAGLIPLNLKIILFKLDIKLWTPTPIKSLEANVDFWIF